MLSLSETGGGGSGKKAAEGGAALLTSDRGHLMSIGHRRLCGPSPLTKGESHQAPPLRGHCAPCPYSVLHKQFSKSGSSSREVGRQFNFTSWRKEYLHILWELLALSEDPGSAKAEIRPQDL